jgi:hypothetical protein
MATAIGLAVTAAAGAIGADRAGIVGVAWGMSIGYASVAAITIATGLVPPLGWLEWMGHLGRLAMTLVMVVGMAHFPENSAVPIRFKRNAGFPRLPADEAIRLLDDFSVVKKCAPLGEIPRIARRIRHLPGVNDLALDIDQINFAGARLRRE